VIAFAGGALIAAVTVVLVPLAEERLPGPALVTAFLAGGVAFSLLDRFVERAFGPEGQVVALVTDFLPEALALGTLFAAGERSKAILTAVILTSQNLPEAFNAWREMAGEGGMRGGRVLLLFAAIALLGPLAAFVGLTFLDDRPATLGAIAAFAAGGILYLVFQDVAPKAGLEHAWAPPLGAVAGYGIGFAGHLFVGG
jgi:ZIP family zinc transporter